MLGVVLVVVGIIVGAGVAWLGAVGARAIFRSSVATAREAGHAGMSASTRAVLRMVLWALAFLALTLFLHFVGKRMGWWALVPGIAALLAMIAGLLQADRLLTVPRESCVQFLVTLLVCLVLLAFLFGGAWWAVSSGAGEIAR
jgi:hypothetical protein